MIGIGAKSLKIQLCTEENIYIAYSQSLQFYIERHLFVDAQLKF